MLVFRVDRELFQTRLNREIGGRAESENGNLLAKRSDGSSRTI
jgi:hypothetical protein